MLAPKWVPGLAQKTGTTTAPEVGDELVPGNLAPGLALELAPEVRVNGIAPGAISWPEKPGGDPVDAAARQALLQQIPLQGLGGTQVIADTVLFLASNEYITGEVIRVDGGRLLN